MLDEKKKEKEKEVNLNDAITALKDVLAKHTGLSRKLSRSILCTFIEELTIGNSAMVVDKNQGGINAVVHYLPEN